MKKTIKVLKIGFITILSLILILNLVIMIKSKLHPNEIPSIFGYKPFVVTSGSMETKLKVGDLVFVKKINTDKLKVGDIIAFRDEGDIVTTHRIVSEEKVEDNRCFKTKGDNNNTEDEGIVCKDHIEGKYVGKIPKVGNFILFIQKPLGFIVMMLTLLIISMLIYFVSIRKDNKMDEEELKEFEEFKKAKKEKEEKKGRKKK